MRVKKHYDETAQLGGILATLSINPNQDPSAGKSDKTTNTPCTAKKPPRRHSHAKLPSSAKRSTETPCKGVEVERSLFNSNGTNVSLTNTNTPHTNRKCNDKDEGDQSELDSECTTQTQTPDLRNRFSSMIKTPSPGSAAYIKTGPCPYPYPFQYPYPYPGQLRNENGNNENLQKHPSHVHVPSMNYGNTNHMNITSPLETSPFYPSAKICPGTTMTPSSESSASASTSAVPAEIDSSETSTIMTAAIISSNAVATPLLNKCNDGLTFTSSSSSLRQDHSLHNSPSASAATISFHQHTPECLPRKDNYDRSSDDDDDDYDGSNSSSTCSGSGESTLSVYIPTTQDSDEDYTECDGADESSSLDEDDHMLDDASYITKEEYIPYGRQVGTPVQADGEELILLDVVEDESDRTVDSDDTETESEDEMTTGSRSAVSTGSTTSSADQMNHGMTTPVALVHTDTHVNKSDIPQYDPSPAANVEVMVRMDNCDDENNSADEDEAVAATIIGAGDDRNSVNDDLRRTGENNDRPQDFSRNPSTSSENDLKMHARQSSSTSMGSRKSVRRGKWTLGTRIGEGSFGIVHVGMNNLTGKLMAVKIMKIPSKSSHESLEDLRREINLMKSFEHPNIVRYIGCEIDRKKGVIHIFQDWIPGGSVASLLRKFGPFPLAVVRCYMYQVLTGLNYLHSNRIIHRDIKGGNILVNDEGIVKLADFGASKRLRTTENVTMMDADNMVESMTMRGTPYFMAPEVFQEKYGTKADVWSCACVVHQMCTTNPPWKGLGLESPAKLYLYIAKHEGPPPMNLPLTGMTDTNAEIRSNPSLTNFLEQCFKRDPSTRPSVQTLLMHPFFTDYDLSDLSTVGEDESLTSSMIGTLRSTNASPTTSSPFSPLKLAAWKRAKEVKREELNCNMNGWPSWATVKDNENELLRAKKKNPFAK